MEVDQQAHAPSVENQSGYVGEELSAKIAVSGLAGSSSKDAADFGKVSSLSCVDGCAIGKGVLCSINAAVIERQ
jgi:hypothetical protein